MQEGRKKRRKRVPFQCRSDLWWNESEVERAAYCSAALLSHPYATLYGSVGPVLPIGLQTEQNHKLYFFFFLHVDVIN